MIATRTGGSTSTARQIPNNKHQISDKGQTAKQKISKPSASSANVWTLGFVIWYFRVTRLLRASPLGAEFPAFVRNLLFCRLVLVWTLAFVIWYFFKIPGGHHRAVQGWFRSLEQPRENRWGTLPTPCRRGVGRQAGPIARAFGRRGGEKKICNLRRISVCISAGMIKCARSDELRSNAELPTGNQNGKALTTDGAAAALMRMRRTHGR